MSLQNPTPEEVEAFRKSLEKEVERVKASRQGATAPAEGEVTAEGEPPKKKRGRPRKENPSPKPTSMNANPKRLFPLKNKNGKRILSLFAKGQRQEAEALQQHHKARIQNAESKIWLWKGKTIDRYNLMKVIVEEVSSGNLLSDLLDGNAGCPSLATVYAWRKDHPDFDKAMKVASEIQAQVFADRALKAVCDEDDPKFATLAKNKHDGLMKRAALQSPEFRERQAAPAEPEKPQSLEEMQSQLLTLLQADPNILPPGVADALRASIAPKPTLASNPKVIEIEPEEALDATLGEE